MVVVNLMHIGIKGDPIYSKNMQIVLQGFVNRVSYGMLCGLSDRCERNVLSSIHNPLKKYDRVDKHEMFRNSDASHAINR